MQILKPGLLQLLELIAFCKQVEERLQRTMSFLLILLPSKTSKKQRSLPKLVLGKFVKLIDVMVTLDQVKDMKTPLLNDFSSFKRCVGYLKVCFFCIFYCDFVAV
jgi:hypothetical protein